MKFRFRNLTIKPTIMPIQNNLSSLEQEKTTHYYQIYQVNIYEENEIQVRVFDIHEEFQTYEKYLALTRQKIHVTIFREDGMEFHAKGNFLSASYQESMDIHEKYIEAVYPTLFLLNENGRVNLFEHLLDHSLLEGNHFDILVEIIE